MRDNHWIITYTGRQFWPLDPRPEDVCLEDIAHALSNLCRFNGHCRSFYSVAQHSVLVSENCVFAFRGLLHDAAEAYLGDMSRPMKRSRLGGAYQLAEIHLQDTILLHFGFNQSDSIGAEIEKDAVKLVDNRLLMTEKEQLVIPHSHIWTDIQGKGNLPLSIKINPLYPPEAEQLFLAKFHELKNQIKMAESCR